MRVVNTLNKHHSNICWKLKYAAFPLDWNDEKPEASTIHGNAFAYDSNDINPNEMSKIELHDERENKKNRSETERVQSFNNGSRTLYIILQHLVYLLSVDDSNAITHAHTRFLRNLHMLAFIYLLIALFLLVLSQKPPR